jgi:hypothetical protein
MVTLTLSRGTIRALGCAPADVREPALSEEAKRSLEPLLITHGFNTDRVIHVAVLTTGVFELTQ